MQTRFSCKTGEKKFLDYLHANGPFKTAATDMKVDLFQNNLVPSYLTTIGDLTVADFGGYGQKDANAWNVPLWDSLNQKWKMVSTISLTWTQSGAPNNTIYGAYFQFTGDLWFVVRFDVPYEMNSVGSSLTLTPEFHFDGLTLRESYPAVLGAVP